MHVTGVPVCPQHPTPGPGRALESARSTEPLRERAISWWMFSSCCWWNMGPKRN